MFRVRRSRGFSLGILMLLYQVASYGCERIPPVTLGTIMLNTGIFMGLETSLRLENVCIGVSRFWAPGGTWRLLASTFHHAHDIHLYYNMVSFLWKGVHLERRLRSEYFAYLIAVFSILVNCTVIALDTLIARTLDPSYIHHCAVGFSGVIFALKVLSLEMWPYNTVYLLGFIPINAKYSCWAELILIQILVPEVSFTGHLAGILVGYAYTRGPLKYWMESFRGTGYSGSRRTYTYTAGTASNVPRQRTTFDSNEFRGGGEDDHTEARGGHTGSSPSYSGSKPGDFYSSPSGTSSDTLRQRTTTGKNNSESEYRRTQSGSDRTLTDKSTNHSSDASPNQTETNQNNGANMDEMRKKWGQYELKKAKKRPRTIFDQ